MNSQVKYLLSLCAIRERSKIVGDVAKAGKLSHFELHEDRLDDVVDFVIAVIKVRGSTAFEVYYLDTNSCFPTSVISDQTSSIQSPLMDVGSISRSETYRASQT